MTNQDIKWSYQTDQQSAVQIIRHNQVCEKLQISSAKLFDMVAKKQFLQPFTIVPGGRAVGFLESDVDQWILARKASSLQEAA
jgi:predicted DNA-binding transcriptional regulator AlpA